MSPRSLPVAIAAALLPLGLAHRAHAQETLPGYRFFPKRAAVYVPARRLAEELKVEVVWKGGSLYVGEEKVPLKDQETLPDGTALVQIRAFPGATVAWNAERKAAEVKAGEHTALVDDRNSVTDGVTFAMERGGRIYAPLSEIGAALAQPVEWKRGSGTLGGKALSDDGVRTLQNGTPLLAVQRLEEWKATVTAQDGSAQVTLGERHLWVRKAQQRVAISISRQRMRAWQGHRLILETRVSTGRPGKPTPQGLFTAGPIKSPMVISHKYGDAKMPWAVQVRGDVMIHGFPSVPPHAASHGCIRVPLFGANPAHWFYGWIHLGTPIHIASGWPKEWPVDMPN